MGPEFSPVLGLELLLPVLGLELLPVLGLEVLLVLGRMPIWFTVTFPENFINLHTNFTTRQTAGIEIMLNKFTILQSNYEHNVLYSSIVT